MEANFSEIADRFQQIIQKMRKEEPCLLLKIGEVFFFGTKMDALQAVSHITSAVGDIGINTAGYTVGTQINQKSGSIKKFSPKGKEI